MEKFHFKGFIPSEGLRLKADRAIGRILERTPIDARISAAIEQYGEIFRCSIEIGSTSCPFAVETSHKLASIAIDKAELNLLRKLDRWRGSSFTPEEKSPLRAPLRIEV